MGQADDRRNAGRNAEAPTATTWPTRWTARRAFLAAIQGSAPEVLTALAGRPRETYRALRQNAQGTESGDAPDTRSFGIAANMIEGGTYLEELRRALEAWMSDHRISAEWVRDQGFKTLRYWHQRPAVAATVWGPQSRHGLSALGGPAHVRDAPADSWRREATGGNESREDFRRRAQAVFDEAVTAYLDAYKAWLHEKGPTVRPSQKTLERYAHWFVRYQVQDASVAQLAKEPPPRTSATINTGLNPLPLT